MGAAVKIIEDRHPGEPLLLWKLGNLTAIDSEWIGSWAFAWLFKEDGRWCFMPRACGDVSLYYNAVFFFRFCAPAPVLFLQCLAAIQFASLWPLMLGCFASVRWSGATDKKALLQIGAGWKLNGRLAVLLRIQSDKTSARGVTGPNHGQATGFNFGTH